MIKIWNLLEFLVKKKFDLEEVKFFHNSTCIYWKQKRKRFQKHWMEIKSVDALSWDRQEELRKVKHIFIITTIIRKISRKSILDKLSQFFSNPIFLC